jgi:RNA polymerase sigma-70 factor, ECF subfamily
MAQNGADLMAQIAAGNESALTQLILLHGRGLTLFAGRYLGNAADGDEIAQETFARVWWTAGQYDPQRARVTTWIYRIAINLCHDHQRRNRFWRIFKRVDVTDMADVIADTGPDASAILSERQQISRVRASIATLPPRQRMAIILTAVAGMGPEEIAASMGITLGAVEQLLVRSRRTLRKNLGEDDA